MKTLYKFILFLVILVFQHQAYAQSRKNLLKEIDKTKKEHYFNASYALTFERLESLITAYFSDYKLTRGAFR